MNTEQRAMPLALSLVLPPSLAEQIRQISIRRDSPVDQVVVSLLSERMADFPQHYRCALDHCLCEHSADSEVRLDA